MTTLVEDHVAPGLQLGRTPVQESVNEPAVFAEVPKIDSPFRLRRGDLIAFQFLLAAFLFMGVMNLWNLFTALFR